MGCSSGRANLSPVEKKFHSGELQLKYHVQDARMADMIHRKYSAGGVINDNQWLDISKKLELGFSQVSNPFINNIRAFYESFKKDLVFPLSDLLALSILLSTGNSEIKSQLLFEAFSPDNSELPKHQVGKMHDVLFKNTVKRALNLMKEDPKSRVNPDEEKAFIERMKQGREYFREHFVSSLVGDGESVSLEGFVEWFRDPKNKEVLTSTGFRKILREHSKEDEKVQKVHESQTLSRLL